MDDYGQVSSALSLTKSIVRQVNYILRCKQKDTENRLSRLEIDKQKVALDERMAELNRQLQETSDTATRTQKVQPLESVEKGAVEINRQRDVIEQRTTKSFKEQIRYTEKLLDELKEVLGQSNLLDMTGSDAGSDDGSENTFHRLSVPKPKTPTPSEAVRCAGEEARDAAIEDVKERELALQDAQEKVDNWRKFYRSERWDYCELFKNGRTEMTWSEFDGILLNQAYEATGAMIRVEEEFEKAKGRARNLGLHVGGSAQESNFLDCIDDGYAASLEEYWINYGVDRDRIERWMSEDEENLYHSTECDDWDSKTVDFGDGGSVRAEGKQKAKIERWRLACEELKIESRAMVA